MRSLDQETSLLTDTFSSTQSNFEEKLFGHFHGNLKKLAEHCDFRNMEGTLIRDFFITNLIEPQLRKELSKQIVEVRKALKLAKNMELGMRN